MSLETLKALEQMAEYIPMLRFFLDESHVESYLDVQHYIHNGCILENGFAFKVYRTKDIFEEQSLQMELFNEHRVT